MPYIYVGKVAQEGDQEEGWEEFIVATLEKMSHLFTAWRGQVSVRAEMKVGYNDEKDWVALKAQAWDTLDKACGIWPEPDHNEETCFLCPCGVTHRGCIYPRCREEDRQVGRLYT